MESKKLGAYVAPEAVAVECRLDGVILSDSNTLGSCGIENGNDAGEIGD